MKIYKVSMVRINGQEHTGYRFCPNKKWVRHVIKGCAGHTKCEVETINVVRSKAGIIKALNIYGGHPDNG